MAETKRESARQGRRAADETADATAETASDAAEMTEQAGEAADEAGHKIERLAERQGETMRRTARAAEEVGERAAAVSAEAWSRSGKAVASGFQEAGRIWVELAQDTVKQGMQATEQMLRCRTLGDVMQTQSELMRDGLDSFIEKSLRLSDISARVLAEVAGPLSELHQRNESERAAPRTTR